MAENSTRSRVAVGLKILSPVALMGLSACSLLFVDGPPSAHASMQTFSCTESRVLPVIDGGLAALSIVGMLTAKEKVDTVPFLFGYDTKTSYRSEQIAGNALGLALFGTSAFIGMKRVNRCREAFAQLRERLTTASFRPKAGRAAARSYPSTR